MQPPPEPLSALVNGDLGAWHGLPDGAGEQWVRAALGDGVQGFGGGLLCWHGGVAGPEGVLVSLRAREPEREGEVELIEMPYPRIPLADIDALGEPELMLPTPWSRVGAQRAWPSRGLAVHASFDGAIRVMAFAAMGPEEFRGHRFAVKGQPPSRRLRS